MGVVVCPGEGRVSERLNLRWALILAKSADFGTSTLAVYRQGSTSLVQGVPDCDRRECRC